LTRQVKTARRLYDERELTVEEIGRVLRVSRTAPLYIGRWI
jgi:hypothetical protein